MKSFLNFISEATVTAGGSKAVQQATRMGLVGDGHGGWYKNGEFVAKTEKGQLKFYNKRQVVGMRDPAQSDQEQNYSNPNTQVPPEGQQQALPQEAPPQEAPPGKPSSPGPSHPYQPQGGPFLPQSRPPNPAEAA